MSKKILIIRSRKFNNFVC